MIARRSRCVRSLPAGHGGEAAGAPRLSQTLGAAVGRTHNQAEAEQTAFGPNKGGRRGLCLVCTRDARLWCWSVSPESSYVFIGGPILPSRSPWSHRVSPAQGVPTGQSWLRGQRRSRGGSLLCGRSTILPGALLIGGPWPAPRRSWGCRPWSPTVSTGAKTAGRIVANRRDDRRDPMLTPQPGPANSGLLGRLRSPIWWTKDYKTEEWVLQ